MVALNPDYAPSKTLTRSENRVGDFFGQGVDRVGKNRLSSRIAAKEKSGCRYETASGRTFWLSRDPIAENGGLNLYAYVGNNPINYWDPLGLASAASHAGKGSRGKRPSTGGSESSCSSEGNDDGFSFKEFFKSVFSPSNVKDVASQVTDVTDTPRTPSIRTGAIGAGVGVVTQFADPAAAQGILEGTRSGFPARQQLRRSLENGEDLNDALDEYENKRQKCEDAF